MHVDADRDGTVDSSWSGIGTWSWGAGTKGAIILCNNDDEDGTKNCDNEDNKINSGSDPDDIAPLVIRRVAGRPVAPASWRGFLEVTATDRQLIRIFSSRAAGAPEIIGPSSAQQYQLPNLNFSEMEFGMEAVKYPDRTFNGEIRITFRIDKGGSGTQTETAKVRVAPWICFTHFDKTTKVYAVATADNANFRSRLSTQVTAAGAPAPQVAGGRYAVDRWMQDALEIGFSTLPKTSARSGWDLPVVLRTANDRDAMSWGPLDQYARQDLLAPGYGFTQALPPTTGTSLDSFGNLECSPPFTHAGKGKEYKFGRIVYGMDPADPLRNMRIQVREFLIAQLVQEPFSIDTGWLIVGHVDEVMSFCPMKNAPKKFKVLLASPARAVKILNDLRAAGKGSAKLFQGIDFVGGKTPADLTTKYPLQTVDAILSNPAFLTVQTTVQTKIDGIKGVLSSELSLSDAEFIHLPVLFKLDGGRHIAYTPGVVNMLVVTKADKTVRLCIPKPFGPIVSGRCKFEEDIENKLGPAATTGIDLSFIDDFWTYHDLYGEIHCGTNSKREPPPDNWWEQQV